MTHVGESFHVRALLHSAAKEFRENEHVQVAVTVITLLLFALLAGLAGLHIAPAACVIFAAVLLITDIAHR